MIGYTPSHLTENEVILEKLNQIIDYLIKNPSYQVYAYNGGFISGTLTYEIANIINSNNINVADVVVFNNGYYGIISEITETEFTLTAGISLIGPQGPQGVKGDTGPQGPKGDTGTIPEALAQEASALKSGNLPTSGWTATVLPLWEGNFLTGKNSGESIILPAGSLDFNKLKQYTNKTDWQIWTDTSSSSTTYQTPVYASVDSSEIRIGSDQISFKIKPDGSLYAYNQSSSWIYFKGLKCLANSQYTFSISDTSITANSDILMELTDDSGVKPYSMEAGKMTVIRGTVPTQAIPYTYKVKQTNARGQFTLVNHYVPAVPTKTSDLQNDSGFITVGEWQNWSDTSVLTEEGLYEIVTTEYPSDGNKTLFVQYEQGKPNNGACWVSVATANSISVVTPICSGDGTLRVERRLANSSDPADLLTFKYRKIN